MLHGPHDDPTLTDDELVAARNQWFERYTSQPKAIAPAAGGPYSCPCCGHITLDERGVYEISDECGWEDDGQDDHDASVVRGGPNGPQSLESAREAYTSGGGRPRPHRPLN